MTKKTHILALLLVCALALIVPGCDQGKVEVVEPQKATTFTQLMIDSKANQDVLTVQGHSTHTADLLVLEQSDGTEVFVVDYAGALSSSGAVTFADDVTFTLGADEKVLVDGATTAHTETDGVLDVNAATITADVSAVDIAMTQSDGATSGEDALGLVMTLTADDADGDMYGISISAAASTNAAAGSYEAGILYDCAENTAGACLDGVRLTAGTATGMTDGFDASDADIVHALNMGVNTILGSNADTLSLGVTNHHLILIGDEDADLTFMGQDNATPADTIFDTFGAGTVVVGSADVTVVTIQTDDTGDGTDLVLPAQGVNAGEILNNTITLSQVANDTLTFAEISDSSAVDADTDFTMADGIELSLTPSYTVGDVEALLININQVDDLVNTDDVIAIKIEAVSESGDAGDTFTGISLVWEASTAGTIMDAGLRIDNQENTTATLTDAIIVAATHATGVTDGLDVSAAGIVNAINIGANLILGDSTNLDTLSLGVTDHHLILIGNEDADLTFMGQDNATPADTIFDTFGAGTVVVGSADVTVVTIQTDDTGDGTDLVLPAQGVNAGEILNDTITFAQIADTTAVDADTNITLADGIELSLTPSHTVGDTEALLINIDQVDDLVATDDVIALKIEATSESDDAGDTFTGISLVWEDGTANTIMDAGLSIDNLEDTASTMTDAIIVTSNGVNLGVTDGLDVSAANIVNAVNIGVNPILGSNADTLFLGLTDHHLTLTGDEDADVTFIGADNAGAADTIFDTTGAGTIVIGSGDVTNVSIDSDVGLTFVENGESINNLTNATFDFTSNADTTVILTASDSDAVCPLTVDSGGAADLTLGSADATGVDLVANGNMDITISAGLDFVISANQFEVQDGSDFAHSTATNEGVVWVCEEQIDHTDVEAAVTMCVIPANANIVDATFTVEIVWTDGTATAMDCGISGVDADAYVDALNVQNAIEVNRCGDAADMPLLNIMGDVGGAAVTVVCQAAETNNDAAAGQAILRIYYTLD